jgi:hypothetical protein
MKKYLHYPVFDCIPDGWRVDKSVGSPLHGYAVIVNEFNFLSGKQKRALAPVDKPAAIEKSSIPIQRPRETDDKKKLL